MNPLTLVKRIQNINAKEAALGISDEASWHAKYKESAYVFVGGIPYELTEGDLLAVFAQYGEIVDCNLVRDKGTGKSKGFAFLAYEDQRSTNLAVDNLNGAAILGRTIRVDHVSNYKKKEEEDEETEQRKREERGVCRAFQRGECTRGAGCKFSHDEQRAANTGWGREEDRRSRRADGRIEASERNERPRHVDDRDDSRDRGRKVMNHDRDQRDVISSRKRESESYHREDRDARKKGRRDDHDSSSDRHRTLDEGHRSRSHRH